MAATVIMRRALVMALAMSRIPLNLSVRADLGMWEIIAINARMDIKRTRTTCAI